jgi:hypothetical protein
MRVFGLLFLILSAQTLAKKEPVVLFSQAELISSSAPVAIVQFASDWKGNFKGGDFSFLDGRFNTGLEYQNFSLAYENRWYAGLRFNEDSARFYYNTQNDIKTNQTYLLNLHVQMLEAEGLNFSRLFKKGGWEIEPTVHWYQTRAYQLGSVRGNVTDQNGLSASAEVDYHYHQDKLLDDPNTGKAGYGGALDLRLSYAYKNWLWGANFRDLWNYWYFPEAGYTYGCLNFQGKHPVCDTNTQNYSIPEPTHTRLPMTFLGSVKYQPYLLELRFYEHSRFQRWSLAKDWSSAIGLLGVSAHSTKEIGIHWRSHWHELSIMSDAWDVEKAHNFSAKLALSWAF